MIGKTISHYRILEKISEGGMGVVYKAEDTKLRRTVALKFLPPELTRNEEAKKRFILEAQAASSLQHHNVCTIHDIDETEDGQTYISMDCYEGMTLKEKIVKTHDGESLSSDEVINITKQIAAGLQKAHENGIIHRDIKPANIFITKDGVVKILDFGLAKLSDRTQMTHKGDTFGTISYMSPEQARGENVDHRTDIWSLGVVMYEMLTGELPFKSDYDQAMIYSILNEEPSQILQSRKNVPADLKNLCYNFISKNPADRYQTVSDILQELELYQLDPDSGSYTKQKKISLSIASKQKIKKTFSIATIIISLIVISFFLLPGWESIQELIGLSSAPTEHHLLILPLTNISGGADNQAFCNGLMETLSSELTQVERFESSLWVVPASEVIKNNIKSPKESYQMFGANLAVTGSLQLLDGIDDVLRLTLNLVDAEKLRQVKSSVIDVKKKNTTELQELSVIKLLEMLNIELDPGQKDILKAGNTRDPDAYEYYVRGRGYLQRYENIENIDEAIKLFTLSTESDTLYSLAYAGLGESYWRKYEATKNTEFVKKAVHECEKASKLDSVLAPVKVTLGLIYSGTGRYDDAIKQFNSALSHHPTNSEANRGLAKAYESLERDNEAESTFKRAINLKPDYWAGHNDLGKFYFTHGRYEPAIEQYKEVIRLTPDNHLGYSNLGSSYYMLERWDEARDMYEQSLRFKKSYRVYSNLATLYYNKGKYEEAVKTYEQALKMNDNDYRTWGNLAAAYYQIPAKKEEAIETYKHAIKIAEERLKINPKEVELIADIASYCADIGDKTKSLNLIERALKMAPENSKVMYLTASTYEHLGMREKALFWIDKAIVNSYPRSDIENQPELKGLVTDERYKKIVEIINKK